MTVGELREEIKRMPDNAVIQVDVWGREHPCVRVEEKPISPTWYHDGSYLCVGVER